MVGELSIGENKQKRFLVFWPKDDLICFKASPKEREMFPGLTYMRTSRRYSHIISRRSSKFHLWWAEMGTQWGTL